MAGDYYAAREQVDKRLAAVAAPLAVDDARPQVNESERAQLLEWAAQLAEPELGVESRLVW